MTGHLPSPAPLSGRLSRSSPDVSPVNWSFPLLYTPALLPFICTAIGTLVAFRHTIPANQSWTFPFTAAAAKCKSEGRVENAVIRLGDDSRRYGRHCGWQSESTEAGAMPPQPRPPDLLPLCLRPGVAPAIIGALILVALMVQGGRRVR